MFNVNAAEELYDGICSFLDAERGRMTQRAFPDGESYLRFETDCGQRDVILVCSLDQPNVRTVPLLLASAILRDLGAQCVGLIAPYLAYMRQDSVFKGGEGVTACHYANLLSTHFDWLVTVDPHLHRINSLDDVVSIPNRVVHAAPLLAKWLVRNVQNAIVVGPDSESRQWVSAVADAADIPSLVLQKTRLGDRRVRLSQPRSAFPAGRVPVLVDDIISTGRTMLATVEHLLQLGTAPPVCMAVHGIFADQADQALAKAGAATVVTCNTVSHPSNGIDVSPLIGTAVRELTGQQL